MDDYNSIVFVHCSYKQDQTYKVLLNVESPYQEIDFPDPSNSILKQINCSYKNFRAKSFDLYFSLPSWWHREDLYGQDNVSLRGLIKPL